MDKQPNTTAQITTNAIAAQTSLDTLHPLERHKERGGGEEEIWTKDPPPHHAPNSITTTRERIYFLACVHTRARTHKKKRARGVEVIERVIPGSGVL